MKQNVTHSCENGTNILREPQVGRRLSARIIKTWLAKMIATPTITGIRGISLQMKNPKRALQSSWR